MGNNSQSIRYRVMGALAALLALAVLLACSSSNSRHTTGDDEASLSARSGESVGISAKIANGLGGKLDRSDAASSLDAASLKPDTRRAFAAAAETLASPSVSDSFQKAKGNTWTTPFEQQLIELRPLARRVSEILRDGAVLERKAEYEALVAEIRSSQAAARIAELSQSSPMTCETFEQVASEQWARTAEKVPAFAGAIAALYDQCAAGATVLEGLWSGFANPDWHSRIVLDDEELPRGDTAQVVAGVAGGALIVVGAVVALAVPGGQVVGAILITVGIGLVTYAVTGEGYVGIQCTQNADLGVEECEGTNSEPLLIGENGCMAGVNTCNASSECGNSFTFCTYGCCEAFSSGLAMQEDGLSTFAVFMELPAGILPNEVGIWSSRTVKVNDRARVMNPDGSGAPIVTTTEGSYLEVGTDTLVGDINAAGNAMLRDRAEVDGALTVVGSVSYGDPNSVSISGPQTLGPAAASLQLPPARISWLTTFQDSGLSPVALEPNETLVLPPGNYGQVLVKPGAHLVLEPGQYHFDGLIMNANSFLDVPASFLTKVDVRGTLNMQGTVVQQGTSQTLMLTYLGQYAFVTQAFAGTLVAPYAHVNLNVAGADLRASIWGLNVELYEGGRVRLAESSVWDLATSVMNGG